MRFLSIGFVLVVAGGLVYFLFLGGNQAPPNTKWATAENYVNAAIKNDMETVRKLCVASAVSQAEEAAKKINAAAPNPKGVQYQNTSAKPPNEAVSTVIASQVIVIEMIEEGGEYKIVNVGMSGM